MVETLVENASTIEKFKALGEQDRFPVDLLPGILSYGIDVARATKGIKKSGKRAQRYEIEIGAYEVGGQMIEMGKMIGQDLSSSPNPKLLREQLSEVIRLAQIKRSDRMYGGDY